MMLDKGSSQENEERSVRIGRLREEIGRLLEREYGLAGKYHELDASFNAIIPDPNLRHDAVLQALSTTLKLARQEVIEAFCRQQEELGLLETAVVGLFAEMGAKSGSIPRRDQGGPGAQASQGTTAHKHCPTCGERITLDRDKNRWKCYSCAYEESLGGAVGAAREPEKPAVSGTELQKKCLRCGGQMHYHIQDGQWLCYTCGHEELPLDDASGGSEGKRGQAGAAGTAASIAVPLAAMVADESRKPLQGISLSPGPAAARKKTCPVCNKKMDWHDHEKVWRCFFCNHKTRY